jgi:Protein of unknown function (DUF2752)
MQAHQAVGSFPRNRSVSIPVLVLALFGLMLAGGWCVSHWSVPWPRCAMRWITGLPCPACGCTRSLLAWTELDLTSAFLFNPLFFLLCLVSLVSCAWQLLARTRHGAEETKFQHQAPFPWLPWFTWRRGAVLLILNWLYLCWWLPS